MAVPCAAARVRIARRSPPRLAVLLGCRMRLTSTLDLWSGKRVEVASVFSDCDTLLLDLQSAVRLMRCVAAVCWTPALLGHVALGLWL